MSSTKTKVSPASTRQWARFSSFKDVSISYEGRNELLSVHLPDISPKGMFINTVTSFPEGTVLKVHFHLILSDHPVDVRCEVRYCLPGVGVGLEFIDIADQDAKAIMRELDSLSKGRKRPKLERTI